MPYLICADDCFLLKCTVSMWAWRGVAWRRKVAADTLRTELFWLLAVTNLGHVERPIYVLWFWSEWVSPWIFVSRILNGRSLRGISWQSRDDTEENRDSSQPLWLVIWLKIRTRYLWSTRFRKLRYLASTPCLNASLYIRRLAARRKCANRRFFLLPKYT